MTKTRIGIIGGGPGGLMSAYFLEKYADHPLEITLFEATHRVGGKVSTQQFKSAPVTYEAGAAELYDYSHLDTDSLKELIFELGLPIQLMGGSAVIMNDRLLSNVEDIRDTFGSNVLNSLLHFHRIAKDEITPYEFYNSDHPEGAPVQPPKKNFEEFLNESTGPESASFVKNLIHSDLATEGNHTSITYGLQNYLMNDPAYMRLYCIEGGNEKLTQTLAERINATIRLQTSVVSISKSATGRIIIESQYQGSKRFDEFDYVIVALPHNHIKSIEYHGKQLHDAVCAHYDQYHHPAHYLRMTLLFKRPFWREWFSESFCMLDQFDGCCLYDESLRQPGISEGILGWLLGGAAAERMSYLSDDNLIEMALSSLPEPLAFGKELFLEGAVHRWVNAVNALPSGVVAQPVAKRHCPEPIQHSNFFFVGDYLFDSTLNGVLDSAEYVAAWITGNLHHAKKPHFQWDSHPAVPPNKTGKDKLLNGKSNVIV